MGAMRFYCLPNPTRATRWMRRARSIGSHRRVVSAGDVLAEAERRGARFRIVGDRLEATPKLSDRGLHDAVGRRKWASSHFCGSAMVVALPTPCCSRRRSCVKGASRRRRRHASFIAATRPSPVVDVVRRSASIVRAGNEAAQCRPTL